MRSGLGLNLLTVVRAPVSAIISDLAQPLVGGSVSGGGGAASILTGSNSVTGSWVDNGDGSFTNSGAAGNEFVDVGADAGAGGEITLTFTLTGDTIDIDYLNTGTAYEEVNVAAGSHTYVETVVGAFTGVRFRAKSGESMTISNIDVTM